MGRYSRLSPLGKNYYVLARLFNALSLTFRTLKHSLPLRMNKRKRGSMLLSVKSPGFLFFRHHYRAKYGKDTDFVHMWKYDLDAETKTRYEALAKSSASISALKKDVRRQRKDK